GFDNPGVFSAIIASPLSTANDYTAFLAGVYGTAPAINTPVTAATQPDAGTLSAGRIDYDNGLVSGTGTETVPVSALTFDFNTLNYDGSRGGSIGAGPISPFSPIYTPFNNGGGAGNAALAYDISITNVTGNGLTFNNGTLVSMDVTGDVNIIVRSAQLPPSFTAMISEQGGFSLSGLDYAFDIAETGSLPFIAPEFYLFMNREGSASLVPEPGLATALLLPALVLCRRVATR
ncbi:MAG: hypothetical protein AAF328_09820, partial [Planctomycetota bacterium]